jgi:hypothetical protein
VGTVRTEAAIPSRNEVEVLIESPWSSAHLVEWLPEMRSVLLAGDVFGLRHRSPAKQRGFYFLAERDQPL